MARARPHEQPGWGRKMDGNVERVKLFSRQVGAERFCVNVMMIESMGENVLAKEFFGFVNIHQDPDPASSRPWDEMEIPNWPCVGTI